MIVKFIEIGSGMVVRRGRGGKNGSDCLMSTEIQFGRKKFSVDGHW